MHFEYSIHLMCVFKTIEKYYLVMFNFGLFFPLVESIGNCSNNVIWFMVIIVLGSQINFFELEYFHAFSNASKMDKSKKV